MDLVEFKNLPDDALIRLYTMKVLGIVPFSTSTLWRKCRAGQFPAPLKISDNVTVWRVGEVRRWLGGPSTYSITNSAPDVARDLGENAPTSEQPKRPRRAI